MKRRMLVSLVFLFGVVLVSSTTWAGGCTGCTPGYWKQDQHSCSWNTYAPGDNVEAVFGCGSIGYDITLLEALELRGGGYNAMMRHAVAALLNADNPVTAYPYTDSEIKSKVCDAFSSGNWGPAKSRFEEFNERYCPLGNCK